EEKHRQANATIKEKEFLISNLLKSGESRVAYTSGDLSSDFLGIFSCVMSAGKSLGEDVLLIFHFILTLFDFFFQRVELSSVYLSLLFLNSLKACTLTKLSEE